MSETPDSKPTVSHREVHSLPTSKSPAAPHGKSETDRPGAAILNSDDPSTEALRRWARDKQLHYPGQDGSFAQGANTAGVVDGMAWGGPWMLPHKGDTLSPPDERVVHGEARIVGGGDVEKSRVREGETGEVKKRRSFLALLGGEGEGRDGGGKGVGGDGAR